MLPKEGYEVVISGVGGKFPETNNIAELQEKLFAKANLVTEDGRRWTPGVGNTPKFSGKLLEEHKFDAGFHGIHRRLCMSAEPMMKLTVERCFEAMVDAGVNPFTLRGRNVAVIVATINSESEILIITHNGLVIHGFGILGHSQALISNRVSYFFNFVGPSFTVNGSWTGGATALEQAATLIRQGAVPAALVTTAYIMWTPSVSSEYVNIGLLTFDSKCRPFDANADGFIRSDGVVTYFLQRREDANRIYASVVDVDSQCLGSRNCGLMKYDAGLERRLSHFYRHPHCDPAQLAYMETEGMAVKEVDAVELNTLAKVLSPRRRSPLLIGTLKSNLGHSHVSASFMSMAKAIIAMETGRIPPTLNYDKPNTDIPALLNGYLKPVTEVTALPGDLVAVNSLSISGTVGHVLLRRHDQQKTPLVAGQLPPDGLHRLILVSGRHEEGVRAVTNRLLSMPLDVEFVSLVNNVHRTNIPNHLWRGYVLSPSGDVTTNCGIALCDSPKRQPVWFVFSGMGSQWAGMGRDLLQLPVFCAAIDKCDKVLRPRGVDVKHILTTEDANVFENILNCFVGIAAVQIGLVDILRSVGVEADGIIGHSAGELGCAYADHCLTAEQMVLAAYSRGKASVEGQLCRGMMAAVGLGYHDIKDQLPPSIDVACHNAADSCTISGPWDDVQQVVQELKNKGVFVKAVNTRERAFHSRYINPIAAHLNRMLDEVIPKPKARSSKWICTSVAETKWGTVDAQHASAKYFTNNLINPVLFEEGCAFIPKDAIAIEIAPHGLMQAILRRSLSPKCVNIPLTNRTAESIVKHVLTALGKLFLNKLEMNINALYPPVKYPVSRGTPSLAPLVTWDHTDTWFTEFSGLIRMLTEEKSELSTQVDESSDEYPLWAEHCVKGDVVLPVSQLLSYPWKILMDTKGLEFKQQAIEINNVVINDRITVKSTKQDVEVSLFRGSRNFEVCVVGEKGGMELRATGVISTIKQPALPLWRPSNDHSVLRVSGPELYSVLAQNGHQLGPQFRAVKAVCSIGKDFEAVVSWTGNMVTFLDALFKLVVFIHLESRQKVVEPNGFRKLTIDTPHFFGMSPGTEVQVVYCSNSNILSCEGLHLEGVTLSSQDLKQSKMSSLKWTSLKFVPYTENLEKLEDFLSVSVQLVAEEGLNSWANKAAMFVSLEIRDNPNKPFFFSTPLQNALKSIHNISSRVRVENIQRVKEDLKQEGRRTYLILGGYRTLLSLANTVHDQGNVFYLAVLSPDERIEEKELQPVLSHSFEQGTLVLLKKWTEPSKLRVFELDWMAGLRQFMSHIPATQSVVVVSRHWQPRQALKTLALETYAQQLRCVFLDKQAPQFSLTSPMFHRQLTLGLSVNVWCGKAWGSYRTADLPAIPQDTDNLLKLESSISSLQLSCVALNTRTFSLYQELPADQMTMKYLDYCGTRRNGERVMGIAKYDPLTKRVVPDQLLAWSLPSHWSTEDAVTVPYAYTLAYYSLWILAKLAREEKVLVHAGMSPVGQAAIAVSLDSGANLYVTVCNSTQVAPLLTAFPKIDPSQVIVMEGHNFELEVKRLTKNTGMHVILNCLKGKHLNASLRSLSMYSRMIHFGDISLEDRETVGMFPFLRFSSLFGVSLDSVVNADEEDKKKLKMFVHNGIKRGIVKPLKHKTFSVQHITEAHSHFRKSSIIEKTVLARPGGTFKGSSGFQCEPEDACIIVGTKQGLWLDLAEWLLKNGLRKLIITSLKQNLTTNISRKFNNFLTQHCVTVMMTTINRLDTYQDAEELVKEALRMGPVAGIFCNFMEDKSDQVAHLDAAARLLVPQLKQFVCLLGGSASVCEARAQLGLSACLIQSDSPLLRPQAILPYLSSVLSDNSSTGHTFLVSDQVWTIRQKGIAASLQEVKTYLPGSLQELEALGQAIPDQLNFEEIITRSPRFQFVRHQLLPVFVLPGVDSARLRPLTQKLMQPAFCVTVPPCLGTVRDSAKHLLQKVLEIQSRGPYNIVGDSWSGVLALQLAVLLEARGQRVDLFLVDAAPATVQAWGKAFCHPSGEFSNVKLLTALLNLPANVTKHLADLSSWEEQLNFTLQNIQFPPQTDPKVPAAQESVGKALTNLRGNLMALLEYRPSELFKGNVHLLLTWSASDAESSELKYWKKMPVVHVMEDETYEEMLENPMTAATINEDLAFSWDL